MVFRRFLSVMQVNPHQDNSRRGLIHCVDTSALRTNPEGNDYFALNFAIAARVNSDKTNLPLMPARSNKS